MSKRRIFDEKFKEDALRLVASSGKSVAQVARDLGINVHTLHHWRNDAISQRRLPVSDSETHEQKIKRLERENKLLSEERDILKKAIAYFAVPPKK
jgi:transposase